LLKVADLRLAEQLVPISGRDSRVLAGMRVSCAIRLSGVRPRADPGAG